MRVAPAADPALLIAPPERWQSGRLHRLAKATYRFRGTGGSNPPLSASFLSKTGARALTYRAAMSFFRIKPSNRIRPTQSGCGRSAPAPSVLGPSVLAPSVLAPSVLGANRGLASNVFGLILLAAGGSACTGPKLHFVNPDRHALFVDGKTVPVPTIPFRYYGTTRLDVLPKVREVNGIPYFDHIPGSDKVVVEWPASPWLFPLDLPLEGIDRLIHGRRDLTITVQPQDPPPQMQGDQEIPQEQLGLLSLRGMQARTQR
jgi:hypothetical protein